MVFARYPACKKITLVFLRGYPVHVLAVISRGFPGESQLDASFFFCVHNFTQVAFSSLFFPRGTCLLPHTHQD